MVGHGFLYLPSGAVGIYANDNNDPLAFSDASVPSQVFDISVMDDEHMSLIPREVTSHNRPNYLGAIVSADRTEVLWLNDTRPLP